MELGLITHLILVPLITSIVFSFISTRITISLYTRANLLDDPKLNHHAKVIHHHPVPRGGGIPIFVSLILAGSLFLEIDHYLLAILFGAFVLTVVGIFDDIYDLNPYYRLITNLLTALAVVSSGIGIAYVTNPFGSSHTVIHLDQPQINFSFLGETRNIWIVADIFALVWIIWLMNIVNWSKGVDGQMPGFVAIAALFLGLLSFRFVDDITQWPVITLAAITCGAYLGFLFWNFFPQKIMPGYGGGSLAGYLLAVLAILSGAKVAALILILGIPMTDAFFTIIRRLINKQSPVWGDRGHLHHHLLDLGWSKPAIAFFYWTTTTALGIVTLFFTSTQKFFAIVAIGLAVGGALIWIKLLRYTK